MKTAIAYLLLLSVAQAQNLTSNVPYAEPAHERQVLDIYAPDDATKDDATKLPVVFWIHGGGWQTGDKTSVQLKPRVFTQRGFVFVSTNYRLLPHVDMSVLIGDVAKSLGWVHKNIDRYGGDPTRIFVMGHSAGAQLAALLCTDDRYLKAEDVPLEVLKGCVPVDGDTYDVPAIIMTAELRQTVHDLPLPTFGHRVKFGNDPKKHIDFSAVTHVAKGKGIPPFLILHVAGHPDVTAQARRFGAVLTEAEVPVKVFGARETTHNQLNANLGLPDDPATEELFEFLSGIIRLQSASDGKPSVSVVVGTLLPDEGGPVTARSSSLFSPFGIDFDSRGNMIIVELEGGRVHRRDVAGGLTVIAGDGSKDYTGDGGPARQATFNGIHNVAVAPNGDIYIADSWNHCIRKIDGKSAIITTVAGTGEPGYGGDGGPAQQARFDFVMCITLNSKGDLLYVADLKNRRIRAVDLRKGTVRLIAGNGQRGVPEDGALAIDSPLVDPRAVAVDSHDQVYILERGGHALRLVTTDGKIKTVAGTGEKGYQDGPALAARFDSPKHLCVDADDNVIIADDQNRAIRKYDPNRQCLTTILGRGIGTPPVQLKRPHGVCVENDKLYVVDTGNNRILRVE